MDWPPEAGCWFGPGGRWAQRLTLEAIALDAVCGKLDDNEETK